MKTTCSPVVGKLKVAGPLELESDPVVQVTPPNFANIPIAFVGKQLDYINCNPLEQTETFTYSEEVVVGERAQITKGIDDTTLTELSAKVDYKAPGAIGGVGGEVASKISFSHKVSLSELKEQSFTDKKSISESVPVKFPSNSIVSFAMTWRKILAPVSFSGSITLNANLVSNKAGKLRVSDVLSTPSDRTIAFSGVITSSALYGMTIRNDARPATSADCAGKPSTIQLLRVQDL